MKFLYAKFAYFKDYWSQTFMSTAVFTPHPKQLSENQNRRHENYLTSGYNIKSWLLTIDHKRIALLYLISITFFFLLGGLFAVMIRLELLTPQGDLLLSETYNKMFTMHGIIMVFFFLLPSIPAVFGNFLIPLMIGAKDLAFPRLNLLSWYVYTIGGLFTFLVAILGGVDTGWTFYTPYSSTYANSNVVLTAVGIFYHRLLVNFNGNQFCCHDTQNARSRADMVPLAIVHLGAICNEYYYDFRHTSAGDYNSFSCYGKNIWFRYF